MKAIKNLFATREQRILLSIMGVLIGIGCAYQGITGRTIEAKMCNHVGGGIVVCPK